MPSPKYQVYNLRETYHELGRYDFKVVLNPKNYQSAHEFEVRVSDSSGKKIQHALEIWGRKLNVSFVLDEHVSDGIAKVDVLRGGNQFASFNMWIIKP